MLDILDCPGRIVWSEFGMLRKRHDHGKGYAFCLTSDGRLITSVCLRGQCRQFVCRCLNQVFLGASWWSFLKASIMNFPDFEVPVTKVKFHPDGFGDSKWHEWKLRYKCQDKRPAYFRCWELHCWPKCLKFENNIVYRQRCLYKAQMHQRGICWGLDVDAEVQCSSLWQGWLHQVMGFTIARALRALSFDCFGKLRQCWDVFTPKQVDVFSDFFKGKFAQDSQLGAHDVVLSSRALPNGFCTKKSFFQLSLQTSLLS